MSEPPVHTTKLGRGRKLARLIAAALDPRAWAHGLKVLNYYNHTHVAELRRARVGAASAISPTASFANGSNIVIGDRARIGAGCCLWAGPGRGRITLGDDVLMAPNIMITAANYRFNDGSPVTEQAMDERDVTIGNDVWIGYGAVILAGVAIGDRAIIGAGAVVHKDVPPGAVVVGGGSRILSRRRDPEAPEASPPRALDATPHS